MSHVQRPCGTSEGRWKARRSSLSHLSHLSHLKSGRPEELAVFEQFIAAHDVQAPRGAQLWDAGFLRRLAVSPGHDDP